MNEFGGAIYLPESLWLYQLLNGHNSGISSAIIIAFGAESRTRKSK